MGFFGKMKDMLFEEEEYTEPIKIKEEIKEEPKIVKLEPEKKEVVEEVKEKPVESERVITPPPIENTFQFPVFDEEEFTSNVGKINNNALEYERKKNTISADRDYSRLERVDGKEMHEKKKFSPSPIISPVYGILNQDYRAEDIVNRGEVAPKIDIDSVRKKAFETKKEVVTDDTIDEPVVTFFEEKEEKVVKPKVAKKPVPEIPLEEESKSIDDLLEEASTEITLEDTLEMPQLSNNLDEIEKELNKIDEEKEVVDEKEKTKEIPTTDDADLYELIDSMYEDREEI